MARGTAVRCHSTNMQALQRARVRRTLFLKNMSPIGWWQDMQGSKVAPDASSACAPVTFGRLLSLLESLGLES